jgi:hypothetical protein
MADIALAIDGNCGIKIGLRHDGPQLIVGIMAIKAVFDIANTIHFFAPMVACGDVIFNRIVAFRAQVRCEKIRNRLVYIKLVWMDTLVVIVIRVAFSAGQDTVYRDVVFFSINKPGGLCLATKESNYDEYKKITTSIFHVDALLLPD